jgi:hypothetical protein
MGHKRSNSKKFFKWVDENFGYGTENYTQEQLNDLRKFLRSATSDNFGDIERESLTKIVKKINTLDRNTVFEVHDELEGY